MIQLRLNSTGGHGQLGGSREAAEKLFLLPKSWDFESSKPTLIRSVAVAHLKTKREKIEAAQGEFYGSGLIGPISH